MSAPLSEQQRAVLMAQLGDAQPATDGLLESFGRSIADMRQHSHPTWEDLFCMNLSSYMGERSAPVLRRLLDAEAEAARLRAELRAALGDDVNPSRLVLDAEAYRRLADDIAATMDDPDRWDGDEPEDMILGRYVTWLADGKTRRDAAEGGERA